MHFKKNMFKLLSILVLIPTIQCIDPLAIRQTNNGPVEGVEQTSFFGKKYYAFRGIPYAEVPITGKDPYTGAEVDRRFKVLLIIRNVFHVNRALSYKSHQNHSHENGLRF